MAAGLPYRPVHGDRTRSYKRSNISCLTSGAAPLAVFKGHKKGTFRQCKLTKDFETPSMFVNLVVRLSYTRRENECQCSFC